MRSSKSRSRNKSNRQRTLVNVVNRVFDSSGPEGKVRGTPQQIIEKYLTLARDAQLSGDRVAEQSFLQHAEHYTRMLGEAQREMAERQQFHQNRADGDEGRDGQGNGQNGHSLRDGGTRDQNGRDQGRDHNRDQNAREDTRREGGSRDGGHRNDRHGNRDQGSRDQGNRDHGARDHGRHDQPHAEPVMPRVEGHPAPEAFPAPETPSDAPSEGLPDAVVLSEEDEAAGPVETPEAAAKPARSRAPRAPRGDKPAAAPRTPRGRRKASDDRPADEPGVETSPVAGEE